MIELYLQMGVALVLVSGLILLLGFAMKKKQTGKSIMKVLGYQSLGPKKGIAMVKVGQEVLVIGVTATDVKLLKTLRNGIDDAEAIQDVETIDRSGGGPIDTLGALRQIKDKMKGAFHATH